MEPRRDNAATPDSAAKPNKQKEKARFQIVKLEERIAPNKGGIANKTEGCRFSHGIPCYYSTNK
jgi:hypothetical protein